MNIDYLIILPLKDLIKDTTYLLQIMAEHIKLNINNVQIKLREPEMVVFLLILIIIYILLNNIIKFIDIFIFNNEKVINQIKNTLKYILIICLIGTLNFAFICYRYYKKVYSQ